MEVMQRVLTISINSCQRCQAESECTPTSIFKPTPCSSTVLLLPHLISKSSRLTSLESRISRRDSAYRSTLLGKDENRKYDMLAKAPVLLGEVQTPHVSLAHLMISRKSFVVFHKAIGQTL